MAKFKIGDKVKAIPAIAEISAPKMKGRVWTVTAVVAGGRRVDLESNGEKLSGILETALTAANSAAANAAYSDALKIIMDSVKGYMDRRIKGDDAWKYPNFVITILRKVCDTATMSAGRYDGKRPPHRIYNVECTLRGYKFQGSLICTGLLHRDDPDDVSAFDEYDMTLSLMNVGKVSISRNSVVANALAWKQGGEIAKNASSEAVRECNRLKGIANKYGQLFQKMANDIKAFSRECPDATAVTNGDANGAISAVESLIKWCRETKILSPEDCEY